MLFGRFDKKKTKYKEIMDFEEIKYIDLFVIILFFVLKKKKKLTVKNLFYGKKKKKEISYQV